MNIADIILLLCLIPAIFIGLKKGFIAQVIGIISLILGGWLAYKFSAGLSGWINQWIDASGPVLQIIAFVVIFVVVIVLLNLLGKLLEATIKIIMLGWLNKLLGIVFAIFKFALIAGLAIMLFDSLNSYFGLVSEEYLKNSFMYSGIKEMTGAIFPYLDQWGK